MKKFRAYVIFITLVVTYQGCKTAPKDAVDIKFNLPKGSKYEYSMSVKMNMNEKVMDTDVNVMNTVGLTYVFAVLNDSAGWKTLSSTIKNFSMDVNSMGQPMHFDTDSPGDTAGPMGMMSKVFAALKGSKFSFTVNDKGEIGEVIDVEEMMEDLVANFPHPDAFLQILRGSGFDEQSIKQNMQQAFAAYPGKTVHIGETWSRSLFQHTQGMKVNSDFNFTLESVNGNDALIKVVSTLSSPINDAMKDSHVDLSGTSEGNMHYDLSTGMQTSGDVDMKLNMKVSANGMQIPMKVDLQTITKGKKI